MGTAPRTGLARLPILSDANGKYSLVWQPRPANARPVITFSVIARDLTHNLAAAHIIDEGTTNLDLHLQPGLTISFKVEDPAGNPITNAVARLTVSFANAGMAISNHPQSAMEQGRIALSLMLCRRAITSTALYERPVTGSPPCDYPLVWIRIRT
jgi:hypothetical protein